MLLLMKFIKRHFQLT